MTWFDERLREAGFASYDDYMRSDAWRATKDRLRASVDQKCWICGEVRGLHWHHRHYNRIGRELTTDLMMLCGPHHLGLHAYMRDNKRRLSNAHVYYLSHLHSLGVKNIRRSKLKKKYRKKVSDFPQSIDD